MTKFNVGDKVIPISKTVDWNTLNRVTDHLDKSGVWNRASGNEQTFLYVSSIDKFRNIYICSNEQNGDGDYFHESDLIPYKTKPTKNQRITALENEVAELKLIVHELRGKKSIEPSTTNAVEDKPQMAKLVDGQWRPTNYEEIAEMMTLTPNQQRAEIIEKAKQFVEEKLKLLISYDFVVINNGTKLYSRQRFQEFKLTTTKCSPDDVFNEHIGKAIALGRALGLDVSEFEQVVQPTEFVTGQIITYTSELAGRDRGGNFEISYIEDDTLWFDDESGYDLCDEDWKPKIINDTNAIYEEGQ